MIKLKERHGGFEVGSVVELQGEVENTLIGMGKAEKCEGPIKIIAIKEAKPEKPEPPKKLTAAESMEDIRTFVYNLKIRLAGGSKSDIDKVGQELDTLLGKITGTQKEHYPQKKTQSGQNQSMPDQRAAGTFAAQQSEAGSSNSSNQNAHGS